MDKRYTYCLAIYFSPDLKNIPPSTITKVHSFTSDKPMSASQLCHVDVTFKPDLPGNHTLCMQASDNRSVLSMLKGY